MRAREALITLLYGLLCTEAMEPPSLDILSQHPPPTHVHRFTSCGIVRSGLAWLGGSTGAAAEYLKPERYVAYKRQIIGIAGEVIIHLVTKPAPPCMLLPTCLHAGDLNHWLASWLARSFVVCGVLNLCLTKGTTK